MKATESEQLGAYGRALILMAGADAAVTVEERQTLGRLLADLGLDEAACARLWALPADESQVLDGLDRVTDTTLQRSLVKDLVLVAHADGDYSTPERALLGRVRERLGLSDEFARRAEAWVLRGIEWQRDGIALCTGVE